MTALSPPQTASSTTRWHFTETRFSRVHNRIESDTSFESHVDLFYRALGKGSDVEVLDDAPRPDGRRQNCCASLNPPRQQHLRGGSPEVPGRRDDERVVQQSWFQRVPERRESQHNDALPVTEFVQFPLRVVRVRLDLDDGGFDSRGVDDPPGSRDIDIGEAYRAAKPF